MAKWFLAFLCSLAAVLASGLKLYQTAQIKGWIPGAEVTRTFIVQKGMDPSRRLRDQDCYWVSWEYGEVRDSWYHRVRVSPEVWKGMRLGDPIEVIHVPSDGDRPYLRNGVGMEWGFIPLRLGMLAVAVVVFLVSSGVLLWWLVRGRSVRQVRQYAPWEGR
jgi:hypothetical protein